MEGQIPAGRITASSSMIESPKKVFNPIGTQSQWSLGWQGNTSDIFNKSQMAKSVSNYHNQSSILLGDMKNDWKHEPVTAQKAKRFKQETNTKPVWNYNPKTAGKTTLILGDEKPDFRKKDEVYKQRTPTTLTNSRKKKK